MWNMVLNMIQPGERDEVFYDSVDCLSTYVEELSCCGFWRNELKSVKERREAFLSLMGCVDFPGDHCTAGSVGVVGSERVAECSGTVSSSSFGSRIGGDETVRIPVGCEREENGEANVMVDEAESDSSSASSLAFRDPSTWASSEARVDGHRRTSWDKKPAWNWLQKLEDKRRAMSTFLSMPSSSKAPGMSKVHVRARKKKLKELSALYVGQEFQAHKGVVWTAKFSPDGSYLATGGEDGVVRVWLVAFSEKPFLDCADTPGVRAEKTVHVPVVIPDRVFQMEELPVQEYCGHCGDILDLAWSNSNLIISSSSDCTVRLWHIGSNSCLGVYHHSKIVTCVQFNPIDDGHFISGSIDGKIRLWTVSEGRVVDWDDARDAVTAFSYQPDGQGLVVGCLNGCCRFYHTSGCSLQLHTHIQLPQNKKSSGNRISAIQFCPDESQRVVITSEDSKVRIFDKTELIQKYRGIAKSRGQMSASVTRNGRHILTVGEDSRVYLWGYDKSTPAEKSIRSCEYFPLEGVCVAVPWCGYAQGSGCAMACCSPAKWVSPLRTAATWPEEMLMPVQRYPHPGCHLAGACSPAWGLVVVAAASDGRITVLHNYGLFPARV